MTTVEDLYKSFGILAEAKNKDEHKAEYQNIIAGVKGGPNEKRLASQFIARFFKHFPDLAEQALDAQLDLCEEDDTSIRKQAIKDLPKFCKESPEHLPKIADILTQLLQSDDGTELSCINSSIMSIFDIDAKGTLQGFFSQILTGEDLVRERAIKFLATKLHHLSDDVLTSEAENFLVEETKKVLADGVTAEEFLLFMSILRGLKSMQTLTGRQQLLEIVTEQAELEKHFEATDPECVDKLIQCMRQATPLLSKNVHSDKFVNYFCSQVLPDLSQVKSNEEGTDLQLDMLKLLAEMSSHCGDLDDIPSKLGTLFSKLLEYLPMPPSDTENSQENGEKEKSTAEEPKLNFSYVECLMHTFHELGRKHAEFLTADEERLNNFRIRLQYFAQGVQGYIKKLRDALQGKTGDALKTDENKIKVLALKTTTNINTLIRDLFHNPPSYKNSIFLSWKPVQKPAAKEPPVGSKRKPITFESSDDAKTRKISSGPKAERKMYEPPSGKYSDKAGFYNSGRGGYGRGGRRGNRGGGQWTRRW